MSMNALRLTILLISLAIPSMGFAQSKIALSPTQKAYNDDGVKFVVEGQLDQALAKFKSSLAIGEANVTHLNIGRTLAKLGRCKEAKEAYAAVKSAPQVAQPTPKEIAAVLKRYESEMPSICPAQVTFACDEGGAVELNGNANACGASVELMPGKYTAIATMKETETYKDERKEVPFSVSEGAIIELPIEFEKKEVVVEKDPPDEIPDPKPTESSGLSTLQWVGIGTAGAGVALLGTALIIDLVVLEDASCFSADEDDTASCLSEDENPLSPAEVTAKKSDLESTQGTNTILFIAGGAMVVGGVVLYFVGADSPAESASFWVTPDSAGVVWSTDF